MQKSKISLVVLLGLAVTVTSMVGCGGRKTILNINGTNVQSDEFYSRLTNVPISTPQGTMPAGHYVVSQIIQEQVILQLAEKDSVAPTEEQVDKRFLRNKKQNPNLQKTIAAQGMTVDQYKEKLKVEQALVNLAMKAAKIPETDVKNAYDQALSMQSPRVKRPAQVKASAILCNSKENIDKAYELLTSGTDFGTVAMRLSESPSKQNQGFIGWVSQKDEPQAIADAVWSLQPNNYSKPIKLDPEVAQYIGGQYLIIKAGQKRAEKITEYKEIKDVIREELAMGKAMQDSKFVKRWQQFTKDADIEVKNEAYKKLVENIQKNASETLKQITTNSTSGASAKP